MTKETNKQIITVTGILTSISHTKDGGLRLGFSTQELTPEDKLKMSELFQQFGHLAFSPNQITTEDMPKEEAEDKNKTPSKRLRNTIYVWSQQLGIKSKNFETFYKENMEKLIDMVKGKLD